MGKANHLLSEEDAKKYAGCYVVLAGSNDSRIVSSTRKTRSQKAFSEMMDRARRKSADPVVHYAPKLKEKFDSCKRMEGG
jgi:hypothetical protein